MNKEQIFDIVINQVNELNETLPDDEKFDVSRDTKLFGADSRINSLSLVSVIVDLETIFSSDYNLDISLTDDRAMTRDISPFDSVTSLVEYIDEVINQNL